MQEEQEQIYMTVGELADKVGVTVRTIQYYDLENLLKPSAKGSRNQRLYTEKDEEQLYKILCFKFMGLSITEIRDNLNSFDETQTVKLLLDKQIADVEKEISALMKRFTTLKNLSETVKTDTEVNWEHYANMIERFQDEGKYIWQLTCSFEENAYREQEEAEEAHQQRINKIEHKKALEQFHKLIAETVQLLHQRQAPDSEKAQEIARRYLDMQTQFGFDINRSKHHDVLITDSTNSDEYNPFPTLHNQESFSTLRKQVTEYILESVEVYRNSHEEEQIY